MIPGAAGDLPPLSRPLSPPAVASSHPPRHCCLPPRLLFQKWSSPWGAARLSLLPVRRGALFGQLSSFSQRVAYLLLIVLIFRIDRWLCTVYINSI